MLDICMNQLLDCVSLNCALRWTIVLLFVCGVVLMTVKFAPGLIFVYVYVSCLLGSIDCVLCMTFLFFGNGDFFIIMDITWNT